MLPVHLRVDGRLILVVGAGPVGRRRCLMARDAGAQVRWVAPDATACDGVEVLAMPFQPQHCDGAALVFACAPAVVNAAVAEAAAARGLWINRADAAIGDFDVPATIRSGRLLISLTTGVPAATRALAAQLRGRIPTSWSVFADAMGLARQRWTGRADRAARLRRLAGGPLGATLTADAPPSGSEVDAWIAEVER